MDADIFVANLDYEEVDDATLRDFFAQYVGVRAARVIRDKGTGDSKGFGFIELDSSEDLDVALELDGAMLAGRRIHVAVAW